MTKDILKHIISITPIYNHIIIDNCSDEVIDHFSNANIPDLIVLKNYENYDRENLMKLFFSTNDKKLLLMNNSSTFLDENDWAIKFAHFNFTP